MKKLVPLLLAVLFLTGCAATYDGPTKEEPRLTEYTVRHYSPFFDELIGETRTTFAYDIYGNRVRAMEYQDDELERVINTRYDDRGNVISETVWDHTGWIPLISHREKHTYDDRDRLLTSVYRDGWGRETSRSTYTYDDEALTRTWANGEGDTQTAWLDENGNELRTLSESSETVCEYDDRGNRTGWVNYQNGMRYDSYQARYDDQDRQIWGARYDAAGNLESETEYIYDDEAHTMTRQKGDGSRRVEYYHEDGRYHRIEDYSADGKLTMLQQYTYRDIQVPADREE